MVSLDIESMLREELCSASWPLQLNIQLPTLTDLLNSTIKNIVPVAQIELAFRSQHHCWWKWALRCCCDLSHERMLPAGFSLLVFPEIVTKSFNWTESQPRVLSADHSAAKQKWVCTSTKQAYLWGELVNYTRDRDQMPAILAGEQLQGAMMCAERESQMSGTRVVGISRTVV